MTTQIAINGFGRIGRMVYRALLNSNFLDQKVEVAVVNDLIPAENLAYLLKYDSVHGKLYEEVIVLDEKNIQVGENVIKTISEKKSPEDLPWNRYKIDIVIEATGIFSKAGLYKGHLNAGAKKVIITAPSDEDVKTIVMGVNDDEYANDNIISNASCTTNCLAPIVYVLLKEAIGIESGIMSTIHSYTSTQMIIDGPSKKDYRRGRAAAENIIPTSTGAAKAVGLVIPELKGKLTGMAFRVPTPDVSVVDLTVNTKKETSLIELNKLYKKASDTYLKNILGYTDEPLTSTDFKTDPRSSIYDATAGIELNSKFFKLISWYDNEWGYSNRVVDLLNKVIS